MARRRSYESYRAAVRRLKQLGLYSGDLRRPITSHAAKQVRRFADVLRRESIVVTVPKRKIAKGMALRSKGRKVIVSDIRPGERFFYSKKFGDIIGVSKRDEQRVVRIISPSSRKELPQISGASYRIPIGAPGHVEYFDTIEDMEQFMHQYEFAHMVSDKYGDRIVGYPNWRKYVEIVMER